MDKDTWIKLFAAFISGGIPTALLTWLNSKVDKNKTEINTTLLKEQEKRVRLEEE